MRISALDTSYDSYTEFCNRIGVVDKQKILLAKDIDAGKVSPRYISQRLPINKPTMNRSV